MGSEQQPVRQIGIYHNLPSFDPSIQGLNAIVTGANGISGFATVRALLDSPKRWSKVFALSRRPPPKEMMDLLSPDLRSRVQHVACDFLEPAETIAKALKDANVNAQYAFFYSYLQPAPPPGQPLWSNADELVRVNKALLENFLSALPLANIKLKRIVLQTGAKNYGVHLGRTRQPCVESDPQPKHLAPNFYYPQEEVLFKYCQQNNVGWNIIQPLWIIGAVTNAAMNAMHPYAIYAAVQAHKGEPIAFPGSWDHWNSPCQQSTARLTGYLTEWAALEDKCKNERFNSHDTSPFTFNRFYEELARWYGVQKGFSKPDEDTSNCMTIKGGEGKTTPMGYGPPTELRVSFSLVQWAKDPVNVEAWKSLQKSSSGQLTHDPFDGPENYFSCGDAAYLDWSFSMSKARRLGWTGFVDTIEALFEMYHEMVTLGMLPPMKVDKPKALV